MKNEKVSSVLDYRKYMKDLKSQFAVVRFLEERFFQLEEQCDNVIKMSDSVNMKEVCDLLSSQQCEIYDELRLHVDILSNMVKKGSVCFTRQDEGSR